MLWPPVILSKASVHGHLATWGCVCAKDVGTGGHKEENVGTDAWEDFTSPSHRH